MMIKVLPMGLLVVCVVSCVSQGAIDRWKALNSGGAGSQDREVQADSAYYSAPSVPYDMHSPRTEASRLEGRFTTPEERKTLQRIRYMLSEGLLSHEEYMDILEELSRKGGE